MELQAAVLASRLASSVEAEHNYKIEKRYFWTDSMIVLHWLKSDANTYKTFVSHRLSEIDDLTNTEEWNWISTADNSTDAATRETGPIDTQLKY